MPTYLDTADAAALLSVDQDAVRKMCRNGRLRGAIKDTKSGVWLIPSEAIVGWMIQRPGKSSAIKDPSKSEAETGDRFRIGNISNSNVAVGRGAQVSVDQGADLDQLGQLFEVIYQYIERRSEDPDVDKGEIVATVEDIKSEADKGEQANTNKIERWLKTLALMAPDILDVTVAALLNPGAAVAEVIRKVAAKARLEAGNS